MTAAAGAASRAAAAPHPASFRDPSGFVFERDGRLLRQVNATYRAHYERLMDSGLYEALVADRLLLAHREVDVGLAAAAGAYKVLEPERLGFVSYPYEWSFGQLKDAALLTLNLQKRAMAHGMWLKDASAYNVQLHSGRPTFIDTLSFERYEEGHAWVAYRQFCQHFLAPLALMAKTDARLGQLSRLHVDGVPLDLAAKLLPWRTVWTLSLGLHLHAHARSQRRFAGDPGAAAAKKLRLSRQALANIVDSLEAAVSGLELPGGRAEWTDYYTANNNYGEAGLDEKRRLLDTLIAPLRPSTVWDLGANTGHFSRVALAHGAQLVVAWDIDTTCVEAGYRRTVSEEQAGLHHLVLDLTNPTSGVGWAGRERDSLEARAPVDLLLALGLIHHLAISNNVPLENVAAYFASLGRRAIVEWVPKGDSQVDKLLATREDVFPSYTEGGFEAAFSRYFQIESRLPIEGTRRALYLLRASRA